MNNVNASTSRLHCVIVSNAIVLILLALCVKYILENLSLAKIMLKKNTKYKSIYLPLVLVKH